MADKERQSMLLRTDNHGSSSFESSEPSRSPESKPLKIVELQSLHLILLLPLLLLLTPLPQRPPQKFPPPLLLPSLPLLASPCFILVLSSGRILEQDHCSCLIAFSAGESRPLPLRTSTSRYLRKSSPLVSSGRIRSPLAMREWTISSSSAALSCFVVTCIDLFN